MALSAGTVSAVLFQIPNAHIVFAEDPSQQRRSEDAIIAWTWFHFINNPQDSEWLLRLPMTKASVRAMDTVQAVVKQRLGKDIEKFCVAGASKRGWTTWTTTIVDSRVIGSIPMVMDLLNFVNRCHTSKIKTINPLSCPAAPTTIIERSADGPSRSATTTRFTTGLQWYSQNHKPLTPYYQLNFTGELDNPGTQVSHFQN